MLGIMTAARRPDLVRGLVVVVGDSLLYRETIDAFVDEAIPRWRKWRALLEQGPSVYDLILEFVGSRKRLSSALDRPIALCSTQVDPAVLAMVSGDRVAGFDASQFLPAIACPVLLLQAKVMTAEDAESALGDLREEYVTSFDTVGHQLLLEPDGHRATLEVQLFLAHRPPLRHTRRTPAG